MQTRQLAQCLYLGCLRWGVIRRPCVVNTFNPTVFGYLNKVSFSPTMSSRASDCPRAAAGFSLCEGGKAPGAPFFLSPVFFNELASEERFPLVHSLQTLRECPSPLFEKFAPRSEETVPCSAELLDFTSVVFEKAVFCCFATADSLSPACV